MGEKSAAVLVILDHTPNTSGGLNSHSDGRVYTTVMVSGQPQLPAHVTTSLYI